MLELMGFFKMTHNDFMQLSRAPSVLSGSKCLQHNTVTFPDDVRWSPAASFDSFMNKRLSRQKESCSRSNLDPKPSVSFSPDRPGGFWI